MKRFLTGVFTGLTLVALINLLFLKEEEYPNIEIIALPEVTYIDKEVVSSVERTEYFVIKNVPKDLKMLKDFIEVYNQGNPIKPAENGETFIYRIFLRESRRTDRDLKLLAENSFKPSKLGFGSQEDDGIAYLTWRYNPNIEDFELIRYTYFQINNRRKTKNNEEKISWNNWDNWRKFREENRKDTD